MGLPGVGDARGAEDGAAAAAIDALAVRALNAHVGLWGPSLGLPCALVPHDLAAAAVLTGAVCSPDQQTD